MIKLKFKIFQISLLVALICLINCENILQTPFESYKDIIENQGKAFGIPGIVLHIKTPSEERTYVYNIPESLSKRYFEPVSTNSLFRLGSISKTYTTALVLLLNEYGYLILDESIDKRIPFPCTNYIFDLDKITIRNLLNHTSGLGDYVNNINIIMQITDFSNQIGNFWTNRYKNWTMEQLLSMITTVQLTPGKFNYSNVNFLLAGKIVHNCLQPRSMECYYLPKLKGVFTEIYNDFNLNQTFFLEEKYTIENIAHGYEKDIEYIVDVSEVHPSHTHTAGGIIASAADLCKFINLLFTGQIVNQASLDEMLNFGTWGNGLGVFRKINMYGKTTYFHSGAIPGYFSIYHYYPSEKITVILLMNTATSPSAPNCQSTILRKVEEKLFNKN